MQYYWQKDHKYYKLIIHRTLFNTIDIICLWGRIGSNLGGSKIIHCTEQQDLDNAILKVTKRRKARGYIAK